MTFNARIVTAQQITQAIPGDWALVALAAKPTYRRHRWMVTIERRGEQITVLSPNPIPRLVQAVSAP